jgi:hypothetical protein
MSGIGSTSASECRPHRAELHVRRRPISTDVQISGLGASAAGVPESFTSQANRPIAVVIVRSGIDGDDVAFITGPAIAGEGRSAGVGDGSGIRYVAFCYDAELERASVPIRSGLRATSAIRPIPRARGLIRADSLT